MAYIRVKKIKGKSYAYLVENKNTSSGPRQKVKKYLGKVHDLERKEDTVSEIKGKGIFQNLIISELKKLGFKEKGDSCIHKNLIFSCKDYSLKRKTKSNTSKEAVISLNEGYLCSFTLQRIANFKKTKDFNKDGFTLAKYFLESGLQVSEEEFVEFYQKLR